MDELHQQVLNLINLGNNINDGVTINEICEILNITRKQAYNIITDLSTSGYEFQRKYFSDGSLMYLPQKELFTTSNINEGTLITNANETELHAMIISDTHLGNIHQNYDALMQVLYYCIDNDIHVVLCAGDLVDGILTGSGAKIHNNNDEQNQYFLDSFVCSSNIIIITVLGNHDASSKEYYGQDLNKLIYNKRHDILSLGYGQGKLHIQNDIICFSHSLQKHKLKIDILNKLHHYILIKGHSHSAIPGITFSPNNVFVIQTIPLSNINSDNNQLFPGTFEAYLKLEDGLISEAEIIGLLYNTKKEQVYRSFCSKQYLKRGKAVLSQVDNVVDISPSSRTLKR